jgi:hypothetical protein
MFDKLWKNKLMPRTEAYLWLADVLGVPVEECHIGMFGYERCLQVRTLSMQKALSITFGRQSSKP